MKYTFFLFLFASMLITANAQSVMSVIESNSSVDTALHIFGGARTGIVIDINNTEANSGLLDNSRGLIVKAGGLGISGESTYPLTTGVSGKCNSGYGVTGRSNTPQGAGVRGLNDAGNGVWGMSEIIDYAGVRGENTVGDGVIGSSGASNLTSSEFAGVKGIGDNRMGVYGISATHNGVKGESEGGAGVRGRSATGTGVFGESRSGVGGEFRSFSVNVPDIEFPTNLIVTSGSPIIDRKGIISSDRESASSELELWSNDDLTVVIDRDNSSNTGSFQVQNSNGQSLIHVHEINGTDIRGNLEFKSAGGDDNGIIMSDRAEPSSDVIIDSNHDIVLRLDDNGGESGQLRVEDSGNTVVFRLTEAGNLNIGGTLNQSSDINRKHSIQQVDNNEVIRKIEDLSIYTWKYNGETDTHLGPMAQDFYAAFGLGQGETTISSVDADGIALAGIKALAAENQELKKEMKELRGLLEKVMEELAIK